MFGFFLLTLLLGGSFYMDLPQAVEDHPCLHRAPGGAEAGEVGKWKTSEEERFVERLI